MDRMEKAQTLIEQAQKLGVRLDFDCNLLTATKSPSGDPGGQDLVIEELAKHIVEARSLVKARATNVRASYFVGERIAINDGLSLSPGGVGVLWGVLAGAHRDGSLRISFSSEEWKHARTVTAKAEDLLMVVDEKVDSAAPARNDDSGSEQRPKGFIGRVRDSLR
ncbi:MAG: hypothetical protein WBF09_08935 [Candidatus Acidiferrum sp.]